MQENQRLEPAKRYWLQTDYSFFEGHAPVIILGKDKGLIKVMLLSDYPPLGDKGDSSWVEPEDIAGRIR